MRKRFIGHVVSDKMDKTCVVSVEMWKTHPIYHKRTKVRKKLYVHDPRNVAKEGQTVEVEETRPRSKTKRWRLVGVVE